MHKKDSTFLSQIILQRLRLPLAEWPRPLGLPFRQFARAGQEKMTPTSIRQEVITKKVSNLKEGLRVVLTVRRRLYAQRP